MRKEEHSTGTGLILLQEHARMRATTGRPSRIGILEFFKMTGLRGKAQELVTGWLQDPSIMISEMEGKLSEQLARATVQAALTPSPERVKEVLGSHHDRVSIEAVRSDSVP
jgi:hypothetical protein